MHVLVKRHSILTCHRGSGARHTNSRVPATGRSPLRMQALKEAAPAEAGEGVAHGEAHAASPVHEPITLVIRVGGATPGQVGARHAHVRALSKSSTSLQGHLVASASCLHWASLPWAGLEGS